METSWRSETGNDGAEIHLEEKDQNSVEEQVTLPHTEELSDPTQEPSLGVCGGAGVGSRSQQRQQCFPKFLGVLGGQGLDCCMNVIGCLIKQAPAGPRLRSLLFQCRTPVLFLLVHVDPLLPHVAHICR